MKSWTSMIAAGTALAILPQTGAAQESASQCTGVPNAAGVELLISVEGAPGHYSLTCQNGALVAVPAEAANLVTSPSASEQATESAASTADAMISGEMEIVGRNMAGVGSSGSQENESASTENEPDVAGSPQDSEDPASAETEIENSAEETADDLKDGSPDLDEPPAALESDQATETETDGGTESESASGEKTEDATAESFAEEPQEEMPDGIPSMATIDQSTGTTDEAPVVSKPQGAITKTGPGSLAQQMAAASQAPDAKSDPETGSDTGKMTPSGSGDETSAGSQASEDGSDGAPQAMGATSKSGPGTLEEQMAAAAAGNGSSGAPLQTGPGALEQQMLAATAKSAGAENDTSDEGDAASTSADSTANSLKATGVPSRSGPGTLEEQMAAASAGNGSSGAPSQTGPGSLEQQMRAATAQSAEAGNGAAAAGESDAGETKSSAKENSSSTPDSSGDQMAAASPTPTPAQPERATSADDRVAVPAQVIASARLAMPGVDFRSVSVGEDDGQRFFALRGEGPGGTPVSVAVEADGQIVSVDRQIEPEQVPGQVDRIASALLPDRSVERIMLSTRENYTSYFVFQGTDSTSAPFALEIRSDGQEARFVRPN